MCTAAEGCDQCVRACPYDALGKESDAIHLVSRANCRSCGVCVAVCPYGAVELQGWSPEELEAQVSSLIATETGIDPRAVAFVCKDSSRPPSSGRLPVSVPCIAMVTAGAILQTVARGAGEVTVVPCRDECPMGLDETIRGRVDYCRELLRLLGGPTESERVGLLDPRGAPGSGPGPGSPSLAGEPPKGRISLFGRDVAAEAVLKLAAR